MGDTQNNISYALPDQRFSISKKGSLVKSYGLFSGENRIHILEYNSHPLFKSNRHGDFVYKVTLREPSTIIVKVDVVDHWLVEPNKRIFELNVSVDGEAFIPVAKIDPSVDSNAIPRSLTISFKLDQCSEFAIQTKSLIELPLIQCLRIKPLQKLIDILVVYFMESALAVYIAVSYTHLRAHETSLHLVCRLLLEKKKKKNVQDNYINKCKCKI
eukprot:TRINITY_DN10585_c0_g1_i2.p2 TRINITY_DN10585_c0_g1~~TRINITY_DN10585_c0_g1_i2.p2  ORF type:complete len:214 (-),score=12.27 TRINITY_DN10585_c0_g1_i2:26-667(-)